MTTREIAQARLDHIVHTLGLPGGYAKLDPAQRKFLFSAVLAMVVPADHKVKTCEIQKLQALLKNMQCSSGVIIDTLAMAELPPIAENHVDILAKGLADLLGPQDRADFVRHLWEIALCDDELHDFEERLIYRIADASGIVRKNVIAELAKASANNH